MKLSPRLIRFGPRTAVASILVLLVCPEARSQFRFHTFDGDLAGDQFGRSVRGAGDVNGDGFADLIVGAPRDDSNGTHSGSARVFSGPDGNVLYTFDGESMHDLFGESVSGAGDVNGDGFADLIVGADRHDNNGPESGMVRVFSGVDGSTLYRFYGDSAADRFGGSVSGAGDVNMDGFDDLIVGARYDDNNGTSSGSARVFSGVNGTVLYTFDGDSASDRFGTSVAGAGDVNGDGAGDLIVGASGDDNNGDSSGSARVFSGADGCTLYTFNGGGSGDFFGASVSGAGDVDADGFDDLIVGAQYDDSNGNRSGSARVFSGVNGSTLYTFHGDSAGDSFGWSVSGAGDVNGDGFADLLVGAYADDNGGADSGSARVFSGADGSTLYTFNGDGEGDFFGISVSGAGDIDGDGLDDLIVGAHLNDNNGADSGTASVFASRGELGTSFCLVATANSTDQPGRIRVLGLDGASANEAFLTAYQLPLSTVTGPGFGYFLASTTPARPFAPPGSSGYLCLGGEIGRFNANIGQGPSFSLQVDLTAVPQPMGPVAVQPGETWGFQCWYRDVGGSNNFTDAVSVTFM